MDRRVAEPATVIVVVTRTGGFAGVRRAWRAEPDADEASVFLSLIERCPWEAAPSAEAASTRTSNSTVPSPGADRFVWSIVARGDTVEEREARLGDDDLTGAWRELVDAVRAWNVTAPQLNDRTGPSSSPA